MKFYQMIIKDGRAACVILIPGSRAFDITGLAVANGIHSSSAFCFCMTRCQNSIGLIRMQWTKMKVHLVSDGSKAVFSSPLLLQKFGVGP
jgi:hypothetical protein